MARTPRKPPTARPAGGAHAGSGSRGVIRQIDQQLDRIQNRLAGYEQLIAERERLLAARNTLTGQAPAGKSQRVSQDQIVAYVQQHPGSLPAQIASALDVPVTNISQHLYRGKGTRFERQQTGWHLRGSHR